MAASGDIERLECLTRARHLTADQLRQAAADYPGTLVAPPTDENPSRWNLSWEPVRAGAERGAQLAPGRVENSHEEERGYPSYDSRTVVKVVPYAHATGNYSSRRIARGGSTARSDQTGSRVSPISPQRPQSGRRGVGADHYHPQHTEALQGHRLSSRAASLSQPLFRLEARACRPLIECALLNSFWNEFAPAPARYPGRIPAGGARRRLGLRVSVRRPRSAGAATVRRTSSRTGTSRRPGRGSRAS